MIASHATGDSGDVVPDVLKKALDDARVGGLIQEKAWDMVRQSIGVVP